MNRITTLLALLAICLSAVSAQQNQIVKPYFSPNLPSCAFDEMNHLHGIDNPQIEKERLQFLREALPLLSERGQEKRANQDTLLMVPLVIHIIHSGEAIGQGRNISDAQVRAQIDILNKEYSALNSSFYKTPSKWASVLAGANIQFCLASKSPSGSPATGILRYNIEVTGTSWNSNNINSAIKPGVRWDPSRYMNIYVLAIPGTTVSGGVVGFSNYPLPSLIEADQDGIVIDYRWFGGPGFNVSGWSTAAHEAGHYLGLPHPFQGNTCTSDDGIADTPNIDKSTRDYVTLDCENGFPTGPTSCGNEHMYVNFMDYVSENCYTSFTQGQINVMRAVLNGTSQGYGYGSRLQLLKNVATQCNLLTNDAGITRLISPEPVTCTPNTITPKVTLRNFGTAALHSVMVIMKVNAGIPDTLLWRGELASGGNIDLTLKTFVPPNGINTFSFYTANPNGTVDQNLSNDTLISTRTTYVKKTPPLIEDFENENAFPTSDGVFALDISNDKFIWQINTSVSAFGKGQRSAMFDNGIGNLQSNPYGTIDALITPYLDLTGLSKSALFFDVAYAPDATGFTDTLLVMTASGCSQVFTQAVYKKGGANLSTAPGTLQAFVPTSSQWRTEGIDLSTFDGNSALAVAFVNASGWGNRLYIDNIRVGKACSTLDHTMAIVGTGCGPCAWDVTVNVTGGNGNYSYQWSAAGSGQGTATARQVCSGPISVTVTDAFGCAFSASAELPNKSWPSGKVTTTNETDNGANNGTATVTGSGGKPPYVFTWSTGASGASISGLSPGAYWVKVRDSEQCDSTINLNILAFSCSPFNISNSVTNVSCNAGNDGSITATPAGTGPFTYKWSNGSSTQTIGGLAAGTYTLTVTNSSNCTSTQTSTISQPQTLSINLSATHETSFNAKNGTATVTSSGGTPNYSYSWSNGATGAFVSNLAPGPYSVTASDSKSCTKTGNITINSFNCGSFQSNVSSTNVTCNGLANGTSIVGFSGGTAPISFLWSNGKTTQLVSSLAPGNYSVTVSDASSCSSVHALSITQPSVLVPNATATPVSGVGGADGKATANPSGGTTPYQFTWNNGANTAMISNLIPGNYSVTVTDAKSCTAVQTVSVAGTNCTLSIMMASIPTTCPGNKEGSAEVTTVQGANGGVTYKWSTGSNSFFISNLIAGNYTVTVTDGAGCSTLGTVEVKSRDVQAPVLVVKNVELALDSLGKAVPNPAAIAGASTDNCGQVSFVLTPSSFTCAQLGNNTVTVLALDPSGNSTSGTAVVKITDNTPPVISCPPNVVQAACSSVTYSLPVAKDNCSVASISIVSGPTSGSSFPTGTTKVTWKARDASQNESSCTFDVIVGNALSINITKITHSINGQANGSVTYAIGGGTAPHTLFWLKDGAPAPNFNPEKALAGNYQLVVVDAGGCDKISVKFTIENLTGTNDMESGNLLLLYPNPVHNILHIKFDFPQAEFLNFNLFDINGRKQFSHRSREYAGDLDIEVFKSMAPGVYWLKVDTGKRVIMRKIVKL